MHPAPTSGYALGVDVGSTYTAAALFRGGRLEVAQLGTQTHTVPTIAYLRDGSGDVLIGEAARRRAEDDPTRAATDFKRDLGEDVPRLLGDRLVDPVELIAHVIRFVTDTVTEREGGPPAHVTLTCPASWGEHRRRLLAEAATAAGWPDVGLLEEPLAAAMHYASLPDHRVPVGTLLGVYDLGGGTFDVAVVRKRHDGFERCGRPGGADIGGLDLDELVFDHVRRSLGDDWPTSSDEPTLRALARLRADSTDRKEALSADIEVSIPVLLPAASRSIRLTREEFEESAVERVAQTVEVFRDVVADAGLDARQLDRVLLVGGSSRMPLVARLLAGQLPGVQIHADEHPKWAVCLGAAIAAGARLPDSLVPSTDGDLGPGPVVRAVPDAADLLSEFAPPAPDSVVTDAAGPADVLIRAVEEAPPEGYEVDLRDVGLHGITDVPMRPAVDLRSRPTPPPEPALVVETDRPGDTATRRSQSALAGLVLLVAIVAGLVVLGVLRR